MLGKVYVEWLQAANDDLILLEDIKKQPSYYKFTVNFGKLSKLPIYGNRTRYIIYDF